MSASRPKSSSAAAECSYRILFALFCLALSASAIHAQDFYWTSASARTSGMGGAYVASSSDALDALSTNPAGITYLTGRNLNLVADAVFARGSFSNSVNNNAPLNTSAGIIPFGAFGMPIKHSKFSFAVGMTPELLSSADWHYVDAPGTADASYGLQEQKSEIHAFRFAAGLGYAINSKLSLGVTLGSVYNTNTLQAPYIFQTQPQLAGLKALLDMHTSGFGVNGSVGVIAHPTRKAEFGLAWKSRTVINSSGNASGDATAQFLALGITAPGTYTYKATVQNVLPQSVVFNSGWDINPRWLVAFQADWINWNNAFVNLPVGMYNGTNPVINSVVGSDNFTDAVPLHWKDQYAFHVGVEHRLLENTIIRAGFAHANSPVPDSTLSPLTAAILTNEISGGLSYDKGRSRYELSYGFRPTSTQHVGQSALLAGEYDNSTVNVGTQSVTLSYSFKF